MHVVRTGYQNMQMLHENERVILTVMPKVRWQVDNQDHNNGWFVQIGYEHIPISAWVVQPTYKNRMQVSEQFYAYVSKVVPAMNIAGSFAMSPPFFDQYLGWLKTMTREEFSMYLTSATAAYNDFCAENMAA